MVGLGSGRVNGRDKSRARAEIVVGLGPGIELMVGTDLGLGQR